MFTFDLFLCGCLLQRHKISFNSNYRITHEFFITLFSANSQKKVFFLKDYFSWLSSKKPSASFGLWKFESPFACTVEGAHEVRGKEGQEEAASQGGVALATKCPRQPPALFYFSASKRCIHSTNVFSRPTLCQKLC